MLEQLTTKWNSIEVQTAWKLEPVLCYKKNDIPASDDQSTAPTTPLTIPAPLADGKSSCDVALEDLESETQEGDHESGYPGRLSSSQCSRFQQQ